MAIQIKHCQNCLEQYYGRVDTKFCSTKCRVSYHRYGPKIALETERQRALKRLRQARNASRLDKAKIELQIIEKIEYHIELNNAKYGIVDGKKISKAS